MPSIQRTHKRAQPRDADVPLFDRCPQGESLHRERLDIGRYLDRHARSSGLTPAERALARLGQYPVPPRTPSK